MYNSDKPITCAEDDLLGRSSFAKLLGKAIISDYSHDNIVIGLFGKWGSGKTSIINIAINEIERQATTISEDKKPIIMQFSPWNFTDSESLIGQFFVQLKNEISLNDENSAMKRIGWLLETYADAFDLLEYLPGGKFYAPIIKDGVKVAGGALQAKASVKSIEDIKRKLGQALSEQMHRIIVIIDDIDRLTNEQIRTVFQLVKQVAGLPNMTYLLSMDREIVVRALEDIQNCDGREYLEKIVQVPFDIPQIDNERVQSILFTKLEELFNEYTCGSFDMNHWQRVYRYCVKPFIKTVRDVNRLTNVFQLKYRLLHNEVNFADLLAVTTLGIYLPELVAWISHNKQLLCDGVEEYHFLMHDDRKTNIQLYSEVFRRLKISEKEGYEYLTALFPSVSKVTGKWSYSMGDSTDNELRKNLRVAASERFDLYFQLDLSQVSVSREVIKCAALEMSKRELLDIIDVLNSENKILFFLEEFQEIIPRIPKERLSLLIEVLIGCKDKLTGEKQRIMLSISATRQAEFCIEQLFAAFNSQDLVFSLVCKIVDELPKEYVSGAIEFIYKQERVHGRIGSGDISFDECLISEAQLDVIEQKLTNRFEILSENGELFYLPNLDYIAFLWKHLESSSFENNFKSKMKITQNILRFIVSLNGKWHSNLPDKQNGWSITFSNLSEYIDSEIPIYDEIRKVDKKYLFKEFNATELEKIATFLLNEGEAEGLDSRASIEEARRLVKTWVIETRDEI